jgi:2,3,4,5-tetrahydropyridine-2-carboxylate N-succinyltransferase
MAKKSKPFSVAKLKSADDFKSMVKHIESGPSYRKPIAFGICRVQFGQIQKDKILTCQFPVVNWQENFGTAALFQSALGINAAGEELVAPLTPNFLKTCLNAYAPFIKEAVGSAHQNVQVIKQLAALATKSKAQLNNFRAVFLYADAEPKSVPAIYLKLAAMSACKVKPRSVNLTGIFGKLENLAWSGTNAFELDYLRQNEIAWKVVGKFPAIDYVDKFPRYLMQVLPQNSVRILDGSKVRFGAHLAEGTTVMPGASYINFNAGTLGPVMVEGRISSSAIVGANSDVGGGASIMGVLSGGNSTPISIGEKCLLGANSVTGVPLGDGCIIDAGIAVLAGTKIFVPEQEIAKIEAVNPGLKLSQFGKSAADGRWLKAADFAGRNGLHFRLDSVSGQMVVARSKREVQLNQDLHGLKKVG